jgi:two-component system response regulator VanR
MRNSPCSGCFSHVFASHDTDRKTENHGDENDMEKHIMVVDDEQPIADLIEVYLKNENYAVHKFYHGKEALDSLSEQKIDLAVLDVMLPDIDGFSILKQIREHFYFPVIMLTAKIEDMDKINGLTLGADDYITKPFNPLELVARVKSQLRRSETYNQGNADNQKKQEIDFKGLVINADTHKCTLFGEELLLTPIEFSILWYLCEHRGSVVSSEELFEAVWKEKYLDSNNTVMTHIARLREKLKEPPRKPKFIKTVWGVGYQIE